MRTPLPEAIRERRVAAGLTQADLAKKLGITQATVSNWELGKTEPLEKQLKGLEGVLGNLRVPQGEITGDSSSSTSPFGVWLNAARTRRGLTAVELAGRAGVSHVTIYNLESGRIENPQERTRQNLVRALGEEPPRETVEATEQASAIEGLGNLVGFDPHDEAALPEGPGVYVLYDVSDRPVYVGESGDVRSRIRGHHKEKFWFRRPIVESAAYLAIKDAPLRRQVERILIRFLKSNAVLNKQHVEREDEGPGRGNRGSR